MNGGSDLPAVYDISHSAMDLPALSHSTSTSPYSSLQTPSISAPLTPYFHPSFSFANPQLPGSSTPLHDLRTPLPSPSHSPAPDLNMPSHFAATPRRRLVQLQEGSPYAAADEASHEQPHSGQGNVSSWEHVRQPYPSPSGDHMLSSASVGVPYAAAERQYVSRPSQEQPRPSDVYADEDVVYDSVYEQQSRQRMTQAQFGGAPGMLGLDILAEAAKRAEMEILASDISEMQF